MGDPIVIRFSISTFCSLQKNIGGRTAEDFEKILYKKSLQASKQEKFREGGRIYEVLEGAGKPVAKGVTNMEDKVSQWEYIEDILPKYLKKIKDFKGY